MVDSYVNVNPDFEKVGITQTRYKPKIDKTSIILNPNKADLEHDYIQTFSEFEDISRVLLSDLNVKESEYKVVRVDLRLDNKDPDFFPTYQKLHRYLIQGLRAAYDIKNDFRSTNGQKPQDISASVRCSTFQCESYDKQYESDGQDTSAARLELRSVGRYKTGILDIENEFVHAWMERLRNATDTLKRPDIAFSGLIDYMMDNEPEKTLSRQITRYADYIYSIEQIADINDRLGYGVEDVRSWAAVWKNRHNNTRLYSDADIDMVLNEIERAMKVFFNNKFEMFEVA